MKNLSLTVGNMTITGDAISVPGTADASGFEFVSKARVTFKRSSATASIDSMGAAPI